MGWCYTVFFLRVCESACLRVRRYFPDPPFPGGIILDTYDAIIIGSGQAGNPLAVKFAVSGKKVALVEKEHIGGSCVNVGCSPTKTMEASGRVAHVLSRSVDYGVVFQGPFTVDMDAVRRRKREIVTAFSSGDEAKLKRREVEIVWGQARFVSGQEIEVDLNEGGTRRLKAGLIFIDTGTRPAIPEIDGLPECSVLNNGTIMELDRVPGHLMILGGGYVGMEFARMFKRFGSEVTIIHRNVHVLSQEDEDLALAIQEIFIRDGIRIILQADTHSATQDPDGTIHLRLTCLEGEETITGTHLLLAAGRVPNTDMLNLAAAGVEMDESGYIVTNERLETTAPGIYALGDVKGGPAFTHISYDDYRIVRSNLFENGDAVISDRILPYVVFIDPQLGRIGLSEREAEERGISYTLVKMPMAHVARALEVDETDGFMKALVDKESGKILGFACLGMEGGELMAVVQVAMAGGLTWQDLKNMIFAHPTLAESLNNLFSLVERT
jgi:pyruvate/2-oxoglutarate dehydrogenase complex dihydrolipoamide dehydrogenase (E3) component